MEDMILILYQHIKKLKNSDSFYSWTKTILVNCCKSILRKRKKVAAFEEIEEEVQERGFEDRERNMDVMKYLRLLNKHQQEAIELKYFMDMDYENIAKISNVPVGTIKSRISTGLKKLKDCFGGEY
jgi:RNA polymerase sigma-70 factor (ECF subfamily)